MSQACPTEEELIALLDGEATENRARDLRAHLADCASCQKEHAALASLLRAIAAPVPGTPAPDAVAKIMRRIELEAPARASSERAARRSRWAPLGALALAAAAAAALWIGASAGRRDPEVFASRGGAAASSLQRGVGVVIRRAGEHLERLAVGDRVTEETAYAVSYVNLGPAGSAFLMVFAVDAAGEVHWIAPAYLDAAQDPTALPLEHAEINVTLPKAAVLEAPAPGPLRLVSLVSPEPLRVSQIEALAPSARSLAALRARFPSAVLEELVVSQNPPSP